MDTQPDSYQAQASGGFSLIEMMVALLLVSGIFWGIMSAAFTSDKINNNANMNASHLDLANVVRSVLSKSTSCTVNLSGKVLDTASLATQPVVLSYPKIDSTAPLGVVQGDPIVQNHLFGKLQVDDFQLYPFSKLSPTTWIVRVTVSTTKQGAFVGGAKATTEVSAQVSIDGTGKILNCIGLDDGDLATSASNNPLNQKICQLSSSGAANYDPATQTCVVNSTCYAGTAAQSTCPSGSSIYDCDATGYVDSSTTSITRTFPDGSTRTSTGSTDMCKVDKATNSASCMYAIGVDSTSAQCLACCVTLNPPAP